MKKIIYFVSLIFGVLIIVFLLLCMVTYSMFYEKINIPVDVTKGSVTIAGIKVGSFSNLLSGDKIITSDTDNNIIQKGNVDTIVEISFENQIVAKLKNNQIPPEFVNDYEADGVFKQNRVDEIAYAKMEYNFLSSEFVEVNGKFYILLEKSENSTITLGDICIYITKELEGLNEDKFSGIVSSKREFEQGTRFSLYYTLTACEAIKSEVVEVFGQEVYDSLLASGMLK